MVGEERTREVTSNGEIWERDGNKDRVMKVMY